MAIILLVPEAVNALKIKPLTDRRLIQIMNGYEGKTMPTTEESRILAATALQVRGHVFNKEPKK